MEGSSSVLAAHDQAGPLGPGRASRQPRFWSHPIGAMIVRRVLAGIVTLFVFFFLLELGGAIVAYRLDRERWRDLLWLFWQRFVYRQVMYAVALQSIARAIAGRRAGWGKLERRGSARAAEASLR